MRALSVTLVATLLGACVAPSNVPLRTAGGVITPEGNIADSHWSESELALPVTLRNLRRSPEASFHLLRVAGKEPQSYVYQKSDLVLFVVSGKLEITMGRDKVVAAAGDVVEIMRGTPMQTANVSGGDASVAYLVFTPALDPTDRVPVPEEQRESAWKYNQWPQ